MCSLAKRLLYSAIPLFSIFLGFMRQIRSCMRSILIPYPVQLQSCRCSKKLLSHVLCARLEDKIIGQQSVDQAAYRKGFSTEDHLLSLTSLLERCAELNVEVWPGLVDFEKAFDTIKHTSLWLALSELKVEPEYLHLLQTLYSKQVAALCGGSPSRMFALERCVKQCDPISPLLFIAVVQVISGGLRRAGLS